MSNGLQDYSALLQQLTPAPQVPINSAQVPPFLAAPQAPPPTGLPPAAAPQPVQAPAPQGQEQEQEAPRTFTEAPPTDDEGMSGLDQFLAGASDSTNSGRFLMDLGMKLLQAPQQGQSQLGHIAAAGSSALNKLEQAKASEAAAKGVTELRESRLATEKRTLESADLRDELTRAKIRDLDEKKGAKGKVAASVQKQAADIKILRTQYPKHFKTDASAGAYLMNKKQAEALSLAKAKAQADFRATNELIFSDNPQGFADAIEGVGKGFEEQIAKLNIPDLTQDPQAATTAAPAPDGRPASSKATLTEAFKAGGWGGVPALMKDKLGREPTEAEIASVRKNVFGDRKKAKPKEKAKPRVSRKDARVTAAKKRRAAKAERDADDGGREIALSEFENETKTMDRPKLQVWLEQNKQHLNRAQRKQVRERIISLKKGK